MKHSFSEQIFKKTNLVTKNLKLFPSINTQHICINTSLPPARLLESVFWIPQSFSRPFKYGLKYTFVMHIHLFLIHLVMLSLVQTTNTAGSDFRYFFNTHTHTNTHIYTHIHRSIICTSWTECGIQHEKSWIAICLQVKAISYKIM